MHQDTNVSFMKYIPYIWEHWISLLLMFFPPYFHDLNSTAYPKATAWIPMTRLTSMKTTETRREVASHIAAQRSIRGSRPCRVVKRTSRMWSGMERKGAEVPRADRKQEPGLRIRIETACLTRSGRRANSPFTRMTMRTTPARRTRPHLTLGPERRRLHGEDRREWRGCRATPASRQVCEEGMQGRASVKKVAFTSRWWQHRPDFSPHSF